MDGFKVFSFIGIIICMGMTMVFAQTQTEADKTNDENNGMVILEEIVVEGAKLIIPTKQAGETVYTGTEVTRKGMELKGEKGKANVYESISIVPGVVFEGIDPGNMVSEQNSIRMRGVRGFMGAMTVDGIPNYGGNPMGPRAYVYDMENFDSIAVFKGAVPADLGVGVGDRGGAVELKPRWAQDTFGIALVSSYGSFDLMKMFVRVDSGKVGPADSRLSVSYSCTKEDKWKGPGDLGPRHNANVTFVQPMGKYMTISLWGNYNTIHHYKYRSLSYEQAKDLDDYYKYDFNGGLTGIPGEDMFYYKFNEEEHTNCDFFTLINAHGKDFSVVIKPYITNEDATIRDGANIQNQPGVQKRTRDIVRKGVVSQISIDLSMIKATAGYHFEQSDMNIYTQNYWIQNDGSLLYRGYGMYTTSGDTFINSPYGKLAGEIKNFKWQVGVKYFRFKESDSRGYTTTYPGSVPALTRAPDLDRDERIYDIMLPTMGVSYSFTKYFEVYSSYGKNFIRPYAYMPLQNLYNRLRTQFQAAGITLNDLFKGYDIEQSDNVDVGVRIKRNYLEINPTVFVSQHKKLLVNVTDSRVTDSGTGKAVSYQQNAGKAKGYGCELGTSIFVSRWATIFVNPTYNHLVYDGNSTYQGTVYDNDGRQIVDTPQWVVLAGIIGKYKQLELVPMLRYIGKRYGDIMHHEQIDAYSVFDVKVSYCKDKIHMLKNVTFSLEFDNIFNKKYVSVINASDDTVSGTSYYAGAPFSVKGSVSCMF